MRLSGSDPAAVDAAARALADGELVAFPTETVYGLGARADDDAAVAKIFAAKGRPADHPLIVHVAEPARARAFAAVWPEVAQRLAAAFWPGPLTLVVPRAAGAAEAAAGGHPTIGLRCPSHPVAQALLRAAHALGVAGVAAPSANRFGKVSPTTAAHVVAEFGDALAVLDGGPCTLGIESAIVDLSGSAPALLRPGVLTRAELEAAAGVPLGQPGSDAPAAPGTLAAHYAPRARLRVMDGAALDAALGLLLASAGAGAGPRLAVYSRSDRRAGGPGIEFRRMPDDPRAAAHELFAALRAFDDQGAELIWVEAPPPAAEWDGVRDRLLRAAAT